MRKWIALVGATSVLIFVMLMFVQVQPSTEEVVVLLNVE